jgi:hypothetical protein
MKRKTNVNKYSKQRRERKVDKENREGKTENKRVNLENTFGKINEQIF